MLESLIQTIAIAALPVIFAITLHEAAHGYAACHFGDPTAWQMGRISLNPLRHIDLVGTIIIPASILLFSGGTFLFGYAKPVPVDFGRLRNPKKRHALGGRCRTGGQPVHGLVLGAYAQARLVDAE
jgi:Zn-dependent protease